MATIALSESQRVLLDGISLSRVLDHVPAPVLVLGTDGTAWLNASARELDDWLKFGDPSRSLDLNPVPLVVVDRQGNDRIAPLAGTCCADHRIQPTRKKDDRSLHSLMPSLGAAQNHPA